jgi:hypothetical protein
MAAMLLPLTKQANEKYFVNVLQHGGDRTTRQRYGGHVVATNKTSKREIFC